MGIKVGDIQEVVFRSITMKGISVEDMTALKNNIGAGDIGDPTWTADYTLADSEMDKLLNIFKTDRTQFSEEFVSEVFDWLDPHHELNEIYFIQGAGY